MTIQTDIADWIGDLAHLVITDADDLADVSDRAEALAAMTGGTYAAEALDLVRIVGESASVPADFAALVAGNGLPTWPRAPWRNFWQSSPAPSPSVASTAFAPLGNCGARGAGCRW